MPENGKHHIFISYSSDDISMASSFKDILHDISAGAIEVFLAGDLRKNQGIPYGAEWFLTIKERIANSTSIVVILTKNSVESHWVIFEAGLSEALCKNIFYLVMEENLKGHDYYRLLNSKQHCFADLVPMSKMINEIFKEIGLLEVRHEHIEEQVSKFIDQYKGKDVFKECIESKIMDIINKERCYKRKTLLDKGGYLFHDINDGWKFMFTEFINEQKRCDSPLLLRDYTISSHEISDYQGDAYSNYFESLYNYLYHEYHVGTPPQIRLLMALKNHNDKKRNIDGENYFKNIIEYFYSPGPTNNIFDFLGESSQGDYLIEIRLINDNIINNTIKKLEDINILVNPFNIYEDTAVSNIRIVKRTLHNIKNVYNNRIPQFYLTINKNFIQRCIEIFDSLWAACEKHQSFFKANVNMETLENFGNGQLFNEWAEKQIIRTDSRVIDL